MRLDTKLVHIGHEPDGDAGGLVPPVHLAVAYDRHAQHQPPRYFYGRGENPSREALERCLASLEDARHASVFTSGQAAAATALSLLAPDRRLVCMTDVYSGTRALVGHLARYGVGATYADLSDPVVRAEVLGSDDIGLVWLETPTNPLLKVVDIADVRRLAPPGALVVVDNTFASPVLQQPIPLGADLSLYSTTKFVSGHSDVMGGALVYDDDELDIRIREHRTAVGNVPGGLDCFLVHRGLRTLSLRMARQVQNTMALVELLRSEPRVRTVHYPGLPDHPQHHVAKQQMAQPGAIVSFEFRGDPMEVLSRVRLFACAVSLGGVRSVIECPARMTHASVPVEVRRELGLSDSLLRVSAGIEDPRDLIEDLSAALR